MTEYITAESFGADLPADWQTIACKINRAISETMPDGLDERETREFVNDTWDAYWSGRLYWYAVQTDSEDEWGNGSFSLDEAKKMLMEYRKEYPDSLIAVIQEGSDPVCIDEIFDID